MSWVGSTRGGLDLRRGGARGPGGGRESRSATPSLTPPIATTPNGVLAATSGSSVSWHSAAPAGTCGPAPATW
jgi:hypothetical protein